MLFKALVEPIVVQEAIRADLRKAGGTMHLDDEKWCRALSFVDWWEWDKFLPKFSGRGTWDGGRQLASARVDKVTHAFGACHNSPIVQAHAQTDNKRPTTVILPFLYSWVDFNSANDFDPEGWLDDGAPDLRKSQTHNGESPIPFGMFVKFYNWFVNPEQNPVFANALDSIESFKVFRTEAMVPTGIQIVFKAGSFMKKKGAMFNLSRFLYDSFYRENTEKRRSCFPFFLNEGFTMTAAVALAELQDACNYGHAILHQTTDAFSNWVNHKPNASVTNSWCAIWDSSSNVQFSPLDKTLPEIHKELKSLIKKGLIPDVYVR